MAQPLSNNQPASCCLTAAEAVLDSASPGADGVAAMSDDLNKRYEDTLGDGLEIVLANGADDLGAIAQALNEINVTGPRGECWDEELLAAELSRLGAEPATR